MRVCLRNMLGRCLAFMFAGLAFVFACVPQSRAQTFTDPAMTLPIDGCLYMQRECGEPAASAWCASRGLGRATSFTGWQNHPATYVIGDGSVCYAGSTGVCSAFTSITCGPASDGSLLGSWQGCDGRVVQFTDEGGELIGRYTVLGPALLGFFALGEVGYRYRSVGGGRYEGQVLWRFADGRAEWRPDTITVNGNQFSSPGSDGCSQTMTNVANAGAPGGPTPLPQPTPLPPGAPGGGSPLGSWQGCDGRIVQFTYEGGEWVGRYTALGGLAGFFQLGEVGYRYRDVGGGRYEGQVLWRSSDGGAEWRPDTISVSGNQLSSPGSDGCSQTMTRVGDAGGPVPPPGPAPGPGSGGAEPCNMPEAAFCFDSWIGEFSRLANAYNGSAEFNGRKPWSINRYGLMEGGTAAGPRSVFAPDDFPQYGNSRNCWMWGHDSLYQAPPFSYAGIPPLKPYVLSCLAPKN